MAGPGRSGAADAIDAELGRQFLLQRRSAEQVALLEKRLSGVAL